MIAGQAVDLEVGSQWFASYCLPKAPMEVHSTTRMGPSLMLGSRAGDAELASLAVAYSGEDTMSDYSPHRRHHRQATEDLRHQHRGRPTCARSSL
jgi:hypothetical protein